LLAEEALEAGRMSIAQDQKELGQELLLESLQLHEQIYGVLHPEVAKAYHTLSNLLYSLDDKVSALELAHKAIIVSERTLGVDHADTVLAYLNVGLFEHGSGNTTAALIYVRHALELWKIIYGPDHPDSITTLNNAAVMLQAAKMYHESRLWFEASLAVCEDVCGKNSINTATLLFQTAQALALDKDMRGGVNRMRESYNIFKEVLGAEDRNTKRLRAGLNSLLTAQSLRPSSSTISPRPASAACSFPAVTHFDRLLRRLLLVTPLPLPEVSALEVEGLTSARLRIFSSTLRETRRRRRARRSRRTLGRGRLCIVSDSCYERVATRKVIL